MKNALEGYCGVTRINSICSDEINRQKEPSLQISHWPSQKQPHDVSCTPVLCMLLV
jgi:hypothetical protein